MLTFAILRRMKNPDRPPPESRRPRRGKILFSVTADPATFPAELWERFRAKAHDRGETAVRALRRLCERYISEDL